MDHLLIYCKIQRIYLQKEKLRTKYMQQREYANENPDIQLKRKARTQTVIDIPPLGDKK